MKKINKKELFNIPNCMSYFRILLIPVFCIVYIGARDYYAAAAIVIISSLTDFLDGQIARRCNMITEFGKLLDPVADKLTHCAIAVCLTFRFPNMIYLLALMLVRDAFLLIMGIINIRHDTHLDGAKWSGKLCTAVIFLILLILVLFPEISAATANILITVGVCFVLLALILYIPEFVKLKKKW